MIRSAYIQSVIIGSNGYNMASMCNVKCPNARTKRHQCPHRIYKLLVISIDILNKHLFFRISNGNKFIYNWLLLGKQHSYSLAHSFIHFLLHSFIYWRRGVSQTHIPPLLSQSHSNGNKWIIVGLTTSLSIEIPHIHQREYKTKEICSLIIFLILIGCQCECHNKN